MKLKGKKVAIFGLGDQIRYPENFAAVSYTHLDVYKRQILGPGGLVDHNYMELTADIIDEYRNTGGFDIIGIRNSAFWIVYAIIQILVINLDRNIHTWNTF